MENVKVVCHFLHFLIPIMDKEGLLFPYPQSCEKQDFEKMFGEIDNDADVECWC